MPHTTTEPDFIKDLKLGDRFRFPGEGTGLVYGPVCTAESSYMLHWTDVFLGQGEVMNRHAFTRVEILSRAPKCACGSFLEYCENECPWPDELEELYASRYR
ncbi:hypothetical protein [Streptomyces sp. NBC_01304]|uniref:hypothetical protein n=1 Tax=Streptomyces sp. NBC_01304 TaxID=2903818 RepID=UPI002E103106|nr:hypothetical protein OG430_48730 [Streptomyces sp. NBC_01304]